MRVGVHTDGVRAALQCVAAAAPDAAELPASRLKTVLLLTDGYACPLSPPPPPFPSLPCVPF
jgi:hypothetical protein